MHYTEQNKLNQLRLKQHRMAFLRAVQMHGVRNIQGLSFIDQEEASELGGRLHRLIREVKGIQVEDWQEAKRGLIEYLQKRDSFVIFANSWDIGALVVSADFLNANAEALYKSVGPDFYSVTPDLSHAFVFDKDEYSCSLRTW